MKKILFYLCFSLLTLLVSCNNREEAPAKQEDKEATKARIRNILVSNGIDESSIRFFDATEADKKNAIVISSLEEFEQMMKESRKQDSISRKEHDEFLKRKKEDSINENSQKKNLNNKRINNNSLWWNDNWNSNDDYGVDDFSFRKRLDLPVFDRYLNVGGYAKFNKKHSSLDSWHIKSFITGVTFGISYRQGYISLILRSSGQIRDYEIKGTGILNYNLFYENIGTYYTQRIEFEIFQSGNYNKAFNVWRI